MGSGKKRTTEEFIKESSKIHNNKYDYSKSVYTKKTEKLIIICNLHGDFIQNAHNHLRGYGCPKCGQEKRINSRTMDVNTFIKISKEIHGDKYDYKKVVYKNSHSHVDIICIKHGCFKQRPYAHINNKSGCPKCYNVLRKVIAPSWTITNWINSAHRSKTFDSYKLYVIKCFNESEEFIKIGRTYNTIQRRFSGKQMPYNYEIIKTISSEDGEYIYKLETRVKRMIKKYKYEPSIKFGGMNECFKFK